jgi:nucleoside-diphosphate-sugar epimerase
MKKIIAVAGATGNLGGNIIRVLIEKDAEVHAIVRTSSDNGKLNELEKLGVKVFRVNMDDVQDISKACIGASCVVSAIAGLSDVIIDSQKILLDAAISSGVRRFIPSDYSLDFTPFSHGENRNLDNRREFHTYLDKTAIASTSIFNGAFADMITGQMPLILFKQKIVLYWGNADHKMIFTTVKDTARYTANVALDDSAPRKLRIAGDQISPREIRKSVSEISGEKFRLIRAGGPGMLSTIIKITRKISPAENELYPAWQGMQYMRNMIDERAILKQTDNQRYADMHWTTIRDVLTTFYSSKS